MPRTSTTLIALLLLSPTLAAQTPAQPSTQTQTSAPPASAARSVPTIQARTNLVIDDVVVTDRHGNAVHDLQASDFVLTERGVPQQIRSFEEHAASQAAPAKPFAPLPPGIFTNYTPTPTSSSLNILLLDTLNTPLQSQAVLRDQLLKYLRTAPPGNRIAIFGLSTRLYLLQGFSSDPALLKAAIDKKSVRASQLLDNPSSGAPTDKLSDSMDDLASGASDQMASSISSVAALLKQFEAEQQTFQIQLRARYTLDALNQLARYLSALPGRKNLIWFSGSFPLTIFPDLDLSNPFNVMADMSGDLRETANLLTSSQVAVYPIDARGLVNSPAYDASVSGTQYARNPQRFARDQSKFADQTISEHSTMLEMADQTGGHAFLNTNGLTDAVARAIDTGANYYTLAYSPTDTKWDGAFRRIDVKLTGRFEHQSLTLSYRRGYYSDVPSHPSAKQHSTSEAGVSQPDPRRAIRLAMIHGAPTPSQIVFKALIQPVTPRSAQPEAELARDNAANSSQKLSHGPYRRYQVNFAAFPSQLLTRTPDNTYAGNVEFVTNSYDIDGNLVTTISQSVRLNLSAENFARIVHSSIPFQQVISIPVKGEFFLRVGVHQLDRDEVGSLEIPVAAVLNLPPAPTSAKGPQPAPASTAVMPPVAGAPQP